MVAGTLGRSARLHWRIRPLSPTPRGSRPVLRTGIIRTNAARFPKSRGLREARDVSVLPERSSAPAELGGEIAAPERGLKGLVEPPDP